MRPHCLSFDLDEELQNRCLTLAVDETPEQTGRIHQMHERDLKHASQITRPILETFQRWLWRYQKPNGQRMGWSTQHERLGTLKDFFRWLTRQNVILHNPTSELELPRPEKRLPQEVLSLSEVENSSPSRT